MPQRADLKADADPGFDVASALALGGRETQEDALASDFPLGTTSGFAVLADGMGGHAAGDVASKIVVTEVFADLKLRASGFDPALSGLASTLRAAALAANDCVAAHVAAHPATGGMGATLIALVASGDWLGWLSVGDSPLYLWRDGSLRQLNEDHSLAPQIDWMVQTGQMDADFGRSHPDRNCLTSVLMGGEVERIDCPDTPYRLEPGDVVLMASDGLQTLDEAAIAQVLRAHPGARSEDLAEALLDAVRERGDPDQDNVSLTVLQRRPARTADQAATKPARSAARRGAPSRAPTLTLTAAKSDDATTARWGGMGQLARRLIGGAAAADRVR
jgi:protein phosphatase